MAAISDSISSFLSLDPDEFQAPPVQTAAAPEETDMQTIEKELAEIDARLLKTPDADRVMMIEGLNDEIPFEDPLLGLSGAIPGLGISLSASIFDLCEMVVRKIDQLKGQIQEFDESGEGRHIARALTRDIDAKKYFAKQSNAYRTHIKNKMHLEELGVSDQDPLYLLGKRRLELLDRKYELEFMALQARVEVLEGTLQGMIFRQMFDLGMAIPKIILTPTMTELRALYGRQYHVIKKIFSDPPSFA
ncbi:MAG TPA: hypothetical protein VLG44_01150 [Chlamydiales bacterium]|nr:hypothetical protein [Chlamydiales bacterium]